MSWTKNPKCQPRQNRSKFNIIIIPEKNNTSPSLGPSFVVKRILCQNHFVSWNNILCVSSQADYFQFVTAAGRQTVKTSPEMFYFAKYFTHAKICTNAAALNLVFNMCIYFNWGNYRNNNDYSITQSIKVLVFAWQIFPRFLIIW